MKELSNEEVDRIAAEEVMGWRLENHEKCGQVYRNREGKIEYVWGSGDWSPTTCRNQSRMVTDEAKRITKGAHMPVPTYDRLGELECLWHQLFPRDEVIGAILAVRASKGEEPT